MHQSAYQAVWRRQRGFGLTVRGESLELGQRMPDVRVNGSQLLCVHAIKAGLVPGRASEFLQVDPVSSSGMRLLEFL